MPNLVDQIRGAHLFQEQDRDLYNRLPVYFAKTSADYIKYFNTWDKLLKPINWQANQGRLLRGIRKEPAPILRGQALPNVISTQPMKDIIEVRELSEHGQLYRQDFDSQIFHFEPLFEDFLANGIDFTMKEIAEKMVVYKDLFQRTAMFHGSPNVYLCKGGTGQLTATPYWTSPNIALTKDAGVLQNLISQVDQPLKLEHMSKLGTVLQSDLGAAFYSGDMLPDGTDGKGIAGRYCLVTCSEVWDYWQTSSYLLNNKNHNLDVVTGPFQGSLFGKWTTKLERHEMRIAKDGTVPAPETIEENPNAWNYGQTVVNPAYRDAPYGVAFAVGSEAYKAIRVGPPPKLFTGNMSLEKFQGMDWNGKVHITRDLLIEQLDHNGATIYETNARGEYLKLISDLIMGILPIDRRQLVPVIYLRARIET